jgi:hypothetical protein
VAVALRVSPAELLELEPELLAAVVAELEEEARACR